jgi:hypothetical protein
MKESLDRALAIAPHDATSLHLLGTWNYSVAHLGWAERAIVRAVYGGLPPASNDEAAMCLLAAAAISDAPPHQFELGRVFIATGDLRRARKHLEHCIQMSATFPADADAQWLARELLSNTRVLGHA